MGASLAMGLAHMGTAGLTAYNDGVDKNRLQEKEDAELAWKNEERAAIRAERAQKQQLNTSLAAAARPAQVDAGYQVTDDAGSNAFTKDADAAAVLADMGNTNRPTGLASATRVQETAYRDPKLALAAEREYNSTPATLGRMSTAAMPIDAERGLKLADSAATARKEQKALSQEEENEINERFNNDALRIASSGPDWSVRAAEALTKSSAPGLQGMQFESVLSPDGKTVSFNMKLPNGESKIVGTYENSERGAEQWVRNISKVDFKTKIGWLNENMKHERELEKIAARDKGDKAPSGYRFTPDGGLQAIPGGPGDKRDGGLTSMDRLLIDGRRKDAKREVDAITEQLGDPFLTARAKRDPEAKATLERLNARLAEAESEYKRWSSAMDGLATSALSRTTAESPAPAARPSGRMSLASTSAESDRSAILNAELKKARDAYARNPSDSRAANDVKALESEIIRLPKSSAAVGLSSAQQPARQAGPVTVTTAAEHAALPKGTRYTAPDGSVRIKQ